MEALLETFWHEAVYIHVPTHTCELGDHGGEEGVEHGWAVVVLHAQETIEDTEEKKRKESISGGKGQEKREVM